MQDLPGIFVIKIMHTGQHYEEKIADIILVILCLTFCPNTERLFTIQAETNTIVPFDLNEINRVVCFIKERL